MPRINSSSFTSHNLISICKQTALVHICMYVCVPCMNVAERTTRAVVKFQKFYFWISCLCHCCWCFTHSFERGKNMSFRWKNHHHLRTFGAVYISDYDIRLLSDERKMTAHFILKIAPLYRKPLTCPLGTDWATHLVCYVAAKYHYLIGFNVKCTAGIHTWTVYKTGPSKLFLIWAI